MRKTTFLYTKAFSDFGSILETVVLSSLLLRSGYHSLSLLAAFYGALTLGGFLSSLSAGILADRCSRKGLMIMSDLLRATAILVIVLVPTPNIILTMAFSIGFLGSFFQVSFSAEVPQIFGESQALKVNSLISRLGAISMVSGFLASAALSQTPSRLVLGIDLLSFLLSALAVSLTKWKITRNVELREQMKSSNGYIHFLENLKEIHAYLREKPSFMFVFVLFLFQTFAASTHNMGIPILASRIDQHAIMLYQGLIWGAWGVGSVASTVLLPKIKKITAHLPIAYWGMAAGMSLGFILFLSTVQLMVILPIAFLTGIFDAACSAILSTLIQTCDNKIRGRLFGVSSLLNRSGFFMGFLLCPIVMVRIGMPHTVWIFHGIVVVSSLTILIVYSLIHAKRKARSNSMSVGESNTIDTKF